MSRIWTFAAFSEMILIWLSDINGFVFWTHGFLFYNRENRLIMCFTFFQAHLFGQGHPHGFLPRQKVLFHCPRTIISFASGSNSLRAKFSKSRVDVSYHCIVVLVGVVPQAE